MSNLDRYTDEELFQILSSDVETEIKNRGYEYGWHKKIRYAGVIYILVNPAFPSLVKIGYAADVAVRVKVLNRNSGLPDPYHVYATYKVKKRLEDLKLHTLIDSLDSDLRHAKNREFYEMSPEKAYNILSAIAQINGDEDLLSLNPLHDDFFLGTEADEADSNVSGLTVKRKFVSKPVTVKFLTPFEDGKSDYRSFSTWRQLEEDLCHKCISLYGLDLFKEFVLDENNKKLHTKKRDLFGVTSDRMMSFRCLTENLYMNTKMNSDSVLSICQMLVERFPRAEYELIYD